MAVGCASPTPNDDAAETPLLDLKTCFNGELVAHEIFTDRAGKVARRFVVQMTGTWQGVNGTRDERFTYSNGATERRIWRLTDEGNGRWTGRADDVVGVAEGRSAGNAHSSSAARLNSSWRPMAASCCTATTGTRPESCTKSCPCWAC